MTTFNIKFNSKQVWKTVDTDRHTYIRRTNESFP